MPECCVICKQTTSIDRSLFRVPKDLIRRKQWYSALGKVISRRILPNSKICSDHFREEDVHETPSGLKYLKQEALPTQIIDEPKRAATSHIQEIPSTRHSGEPLINSKMNEVLNRDDSFKSQNSAPVKGVGKTAVKRVRFEIPYNGKENTNTSNGYSCTPTTTTTVRSCFPIQAAPEEHISITPPAVIKRVNADKSFNQKTNATNFQFIVPQPAVTSALEKLAVQNHNLSIENVQCSNLPHAVITRINPSDVYVMSDSSMISEAPAIQTGQTSCFYLVPSPSVSANSVSPPFVTKLANLHNQVKHEVESEAVEMESETEADLSETLTVSDTSETLTASETEEICAAMERFRDGDVAEKDKELLRGSSGTSGASVPLEVTPDSALCSTTNEVFNSAVPRDLSTYDATPDVILETTPMSTQRRRRVVYVGDVSVEDMIGGNKHAEKCWNIIQKQWKYQSERLEEVNKDNDELKSLIKVYKDLASKLQKDGYLSDSDPNVLKLQEDGLYNSDNEESNYTIGHNSSDESNNIMRNMHFWEVE